MPPDRHDPGPEAPAGAALLVAVLLAVGALGWWIQLRPAPVLESGSLARLPHALGPWRGRDVPLEDTVEAMLVADRNVQREYRAGRALVWLYLGYYGTERGGRPEHTPEYCYPSAGWHIEREGRFERDGLAANELLVERDGQRRLVHYWYRSHRTARLLSTWDTAWDRLRGRIESGRGDGALVRFSTPIAGDGLAGARERLHQLARAVEEELGPRWPTETEPS